MPAQNSKNSARKAAPAGGGIQTPCSKCPVRSLSTFRKFENKEIEFVETFKTGELSVQAGSTIFLEDNNSPHLYTILEGWAVRYKVFEDGRRQVYNFAMRGDLLGMQSVLFDKMLHSVEALTDVRLCVFQRDKIWQLYGSHPGLGFDLTWMAAREESILAEHLAAVGRKSALERIAYILIYLFDRSRRAGLTAKDALEIPLTQEHIADAMGLSLVHTNKTLQRLKKTGWIEWNRNIIKILDEEKLTALADYDREGNRARPFI